LDAAPVPSNDLVDILLPTHCRPHTIDWSIRSALQQTHTTFQLHVICDGCDGETERVVARHDDPRVRFHRFPKAYGYGYANRNVVLAATHGAFIAYLTDDDLWFPDHLATALHALRTRQLDLVALRSCTVYPPDTVDPFFFAFDWNTPLMTRFVRHWFTGSLNCVHRRSVFDRVGYWEAQIPRFGDREFYNRARARVASDFVNAITILRFYAIHWDGQYATLPEPPQRRYFDVVGDEGWRSGIRRSAESTARSAAVRRRQWHDFVRFAAQSGPKFARFWVERGLRSLRRPR
jgi:glycosyltransferase involved in cell wall biosynthesis